MPYIFICFIKYAILSDILKIIKIIIIHTQNTAIITKPIVLRKTYALFMFNLEINVGKFHKKIL